MKFRVVEVMALTYSYYRAGNRSFLRKELLENFKWNNKNIFEMESNFFRKVLDYCVHRNIISENEAFNLLFIRQCKRCKNYDGVIFFPLGGFE